MLNLNQTKEADLILLRESMLVDAERFSEDIREIEQELIIRQLPFCKPLCDVLYTQRKNN